MRKSKLDVRGALAAMLGQDLSQTHGLGSHTVPPLIGECGDDMTKWPTENHFTSWLGLAPATRSLVDAYGVQRPGALRTE